MKTIIKIFLLCLMLSIGYTNAWAQVEGEPTPASLSEEPQSTYSSLLNRLLNNLSQDACTDKFAETLRKWDPGKTTIAEAFGVLKDLEFHMKTLHLKPEWKEVQLKWRRKVSSSKEKTDVVILLKELESNMQPTAFSKLWTNARAAWLADVEKYLKKD
jgi:hypothetical protein